MANFDKSREIAYDIFSKDYDLGFLNNNIGTLCRKRVHAYLKRYIKENSFVLDIGCGTGEDALYVASLNCSVDAIDISKEMLKIAKNKSKSNPCGYRVRFLKESVNSLKYNRDYDFVLLNFGVFNFIDDIPSFVEFIGKSLRDGGFLFIVSYNKLNFWEIIYFFIKKEISEIFRRKKQNLSLHTGGTKIIVHPYAPRDIKKILSNKLNPVKITPVNSFIPPAFFDKIITKKLLDFLVLCENIPVFEKLRANFSDYFIYIFRR